MRNAGRVSWLAGGQGLQGWCGRRRCFPHPDEPGEEAPRGRSFCSPLLLQTCVMCSFLSHSFCPISSCSGLSRNGMMLRPVWGQRELAAEGVQFLGLLEEGLATHSHCAHFSVAPLFSWTLFPFPHHWGLFCLFFLFSLSAFLCGWSWHE